MSAPVSLREGTLVASILRRLNATPDCRAVKTHGNAYGHAGEPDIIGAYEGRMFAIEVKTPTGRPTKLQLHALRLWEQAGVRVGLARSVAEAEWIAFGDGDLPPINLHSDDVQDRWSRPRRAAGS